VTPERLFREDGLAPGLRYAFAEDEGRIIAVSVVGDLTFLLRPRINAATLMAYARKAVFRKVHDPAAPTTLARALIAVRTIEIAMFFDEITGIGIILTCTPPAKGPRIPW
jgi:hypothetical protein